MRALFTTYEPTLIRCEVISNMTSFSPYSINFPAIRARDRWDYLQHGHRKGSSSDEVEPKHIESKTPQELVRNHFCFICMTYCCEFHNSLDMHNDNAPHWSQVDQSRLKQEALQQPPDGWTLEEWSALLSGLSIFAKTELSSLKILVKTKSIEEIEECINERKLHAEPFPPVPRKIKKDTNRQLATMKRSLDGEPEFNHYYPCGHSGDCVPGECPCLEKTHLCTKYCRCGPTCAYRLQGCRCNGACSSNLCTCHSYGLECDPDLCGCCQNPNSKCRNRQLQQNRSKKLYLAKSTLENAGWGIFLAEDAAKGDLIQEYTGEFIPYSESDRRGKVYAILKRNYIFRLTDDFDIDSIRFGSEVRFANHSTHGNCHPKRLFTGGKYRIGIYASMNLCAGDEVLFNYEYSDEQLEEYGIEG
eukprot:TRINITY_DN5105_c0_g3_i2.p1 TRINITY_DN5105_c0_g3~~TRINITY_DN5105_c0_g3_i2.p1  ORF type:complete len:416 (-),score=48.50 TRINITY_DN5105_c0_g3_i2:240-1487(-)